MHAFEQIVAEIMEREGYWVQASVKVNLEKEEKARLGNKSMPRPEIDIVAYNARSNRILLIECKSYFDSQGVVAADVIGTGKGKDRYKLFTNEALREAIEGRLVADFVKQGRCRLRPTVEYWLVCGNIKAGNEADLESHFKSRGWKLRDRQWLAQRLKSAAGGKYENLVSTMVAKILK